MVNSIKNGHGATAVSVVKGAGVGNRHANKRQLAALAATILAGDANFKLSKCQLAQILGVSIAYIGIAQQLSAVRRDAIIAGEDSINFTTLLKGPKTPLALPAPKLVTDKALEDIIRSVGIDRALTAAAAVETHAHAA
jgi:hypothetical protein